MSLKLLTHPQELRQAFFNLKTPEDIASLLDIQYGHLNYHLYISKPNKRYVTFSIPKKSGDTRKIYAPSGALKLIQQKLNQVLQAVYTPKPSAHGFLVNRSVLTNAQKHIGKRYVLNVDLLDFFPSINFGRVRGVFLSPPYCLPEKVATVLAQICCHENFLPQGAPTSPIVSNMICRKLDNQLQDLAQEYRCTYTRYADDITFSTSVRVFPASLAKIISDNTDKVEIGDDLLKVIRENRFDINPRKLRLQTVKKRQEVTGLVTNEFPNVSRKYVRQIRAMLYAWEKHGYERAEEEFITKYDRKHRCFSSPEGLFKRVVKGKIDYLGMIKGKNDPVYLKYREKLGQIEPQFAIKYTAPLSITPKLFTEGKTDLKHLEAALTNLNSRQKWTHISVEFQEMKTDQGSSELLRLLKYHSISLQQIPIIGIFDCDEDAICKEVMTPDKSYKCWGNNVFSFTIPVPPHRGNNPKISIEFYYKDDVIKREDRNGRRLFLSDEFHPKSGKHRRKPNLNCTHKHYRGTEIKIVDNDVYNENHENVALPKDDFAQYILNGDEGFSNIDFSTFGEIFKIIEQIVRENFT